MRQVETQAKERAINERGEMVRAILEGRKTQTRRVIKSNWWRCLDPESANDRAQASGMCPYGQPGDRLWVRECWSGEYWLRDTRPSSRPLKTLDPKTWYWADGNPPSGDWEWPRASTQMPRWASRITLEITSVRVKQLKEISEEDAQAEGIERVGGGRYWLGFDVDKVLGKRKTHGSARGAFRSMWQSIHGPDSFDERWVWVIEFRRIDNEKR